MRLPLSAGFVLALLATGAARADAYVATSNSAMSVTGNIEMDDFAITFANGERLTFSDLVADHFVVYGEDVPASVFRIAEPADPVLENDNALCGSGPVTYLANWSVGEQATAVAVFTGSAPPENDEAACAIYVYDQ